MSQLVLGIGEYGSCKTPDGVIKTYALGSCVAVVLLDPRTRARARPSKAPRLRRIRAAKRLYRPAQEARWDDQACAPRIAKRCARR